MGVAVVVRVLRVAAAALGIAALVTAVVQRTGPLSNYVSFVPIESNVLAAAVLLVGGLVDPRSSSWPWCWRPGWRCSRSPCGIARQRLAAQSPAARTMSKRT